MRVDQRIGCCFALEFRVNVNFRVCLCDALLCSLDERCVDAECGRDAVADGLFLTVKECDAKYHPERQCAPVVVDGSVPIRVDCADWKCVRLSERVGFSQRVAERVI